MKKYRCNLCGQIVEVNEGENCPICGAPFSELELVEEEDDKK